MNKLGGLEHLVDALQAVHENAHKASVAASNASEDADDAYDAYYASLQAYGEAWAQCVRTYAPSRSIRPKARGVEE